MGVEGEYILRGGRLFKYHIDSQVMTCESSAVLRGSAPPDYLHDLSGFRVYRPLMTPPLINPDHELYVAKGGARDSDHENGVRNCHLVCCLNKVGDRETGFRVFRSVLQTLVKGAIE